MPAQSDSPIVWLFYMQLLLFLGPGAVALLDLWRRNRRDAKSARGGKVLDGNVQALRPSVMELPSEEQELSEESRRAS